MIRDGQHDILKSSWLLQCIKSGSLVPIQRRCAPDSTGVAASGRARLTAAVCGASPSPFGPQAYRVPHTGHAPADGALLGPARRQLHGRRDDGRVERRTCGAVTPPVTQRRQPLISGPSPHVILVATDCPPCADAQVGRHGGPQRRVGAARAGRERRLAPARVEHCSGGDRTPCGAAFNARHGRRGAGHGRGKLAR